MCDFMDYIGSIIFGIFYDKDKDKDKRKPNYIEKLKNS